MCVVSFSDQADARKHKLQHAMEEQLAAQKIAREEQLRRWAEEDAQQAAQESQA